MPSSTCKSLFDVAHGKDTLRLRVLTHDIRGYRSPGSHLLTYSIAFYLRLAYPAHIILSNKTEMDLEIIRKLSAYFVSRSHAAGIKEEYKHSPDEATSNSELILPRVIFPTTSFI